MRYGAGAPLRDRIATQASFWAILCLELAASPAHAAPTSGAGDRGDELAAPATSLQEPQAPAKFTCRVECPELTAEKAAEVEARARAALITREAQVSEATLACDFEQVSATVTGERGAVRSVAAKSGRNLNDLLVDTFEAALSRLSAEALAGAAPADPNGPRAATEAAELSPRSSPVALAPSPPPPPPPPPLSLRSSSSQSGATAPPRAEVQSGAALESWGGNATMGPLASASYGSRALALALRLELLLPLRPRPAFRAFEFSAALAVHWQPSWSRGARLLVGAGVSSLSATPHEPYEARGATRVAAGFATVTLSRPIWLQAWALVPEGGVRLFAERRSVTLDRDAQLHLPRVAPQLAISLLRRFE